MRYCICNREPVLLGIHCRFLRIFVIRDRDPRDVIIDCGYVMHFLYFWKKDIQIRKVADVKHNILTTETYQDMLSVAQCVILAAKVFAERFPNVLFDPSRYVAHMHTICTFTVMLDAYLL